MMIKKHEGKVKAYKSISRSTVQFELEELNKIIELTVSTPWVIDKKDKVIIAGEDDPDSGKFIALAYRNKTKNVFGKYDADVAGGKLFIVVGYLLFWAIFPLFTHVPAGRRMVKLGEKVEEAEYLLKTESFQASKVFQ